jgi:hypothetical protein
LFNVATKKEKKVQLGGKECCKGHTQLEQLHVAFKTRGSLPLPVKNFFPPHPSIHPSTRQLGSLVKENKCSGFQVSFQKLLLQYTQTDSIWVNPPAAVVVFG